MKAVVCGSNDMNPAGAAATLQVVAAQALNMAHQHNIQRRQDVTAA
jgi:hypothetical protein